MILTVDIGNTTIGFGIMRKGKLIFHSRIETSLSPKKMAGEVTLIVKKVEKSGHILKVAVICSVVPKMTIIVEQLLKRLIGVDVKVVGRDVIVPMKNRYRNPKQVGQDRLVGAYAAMQLYGKPVIVIDLGTAITFDIVSVKGEYLGGAIVPGLRLSAESLFLKTAMLPKIHIAAPKTVIGRTTQESILSGLFYGYGSLCRGFIELISAQLKAKPKVVMTGGHTQLMKRFVAPAVRILDEDLVHKGMALLIKI